MAMHTMLINKPPDSGKGLSFVKEEENNVYLKYIRLMF